MLTNPPYFKKWCNTKIQRGNGAIRFFSAILISPQILPDFRSSLISLCVKVRIPYPLSLISATKIIFK